MADAYRIEDEPRPGALANAVVHPLWPLLSVMFGGAWLAWPWFVLNGFAVGSPTRFKELTWAVAGFLGMAAVAAGVIVLAEFQLIQDAVVSYSLLVLTVWKLAVSYILFNHQSRSFDLYEYYGGTVRSGLLVVIVAGVYGRRAVMELLPSEFWKLVLG